MKKEIVLSVFLAGAILWIWTLPETGEEIDGYNGVIVYYNGLTGKHISERHTIEGYNLGLKYQCVEFVKRYYYERLDHKMPDSYGHAKDFFLPSVGDGQMNTQRNLIQFSNPSISPPQEEDLLVLKPTAINQFGHVGIISSASSEEIEMISQNTTVFGNTRESFQVKQNADGLWHIENDRILGWLRKR